MQQADTPHSGRLKFRDILYNNDQLGPFPTQLLKRVDNPTNTIVGPVARRDQRAHVFARSAKGEFGAEIQQGIMRMTKRFPLGAALVDLQGHVNSIRTKRVATASGKAPIPDDPRVRSRHLKSLGYFLGADIMGICKLPQSALYTHHYDGTPIETDLPYAIVFVSRKHERTIRASNGWDQIIDPASFQAYQRVALQSEVAANYIRRLGWRAEPSNMDAYLTLMPQILLMAGIGEVSRMGIILNPFLGTNFKAACVLTDMALEVDKPVDFGLQEYCGDCRICAEQCPSGAISSGDQVLYNGYYTWKLNAEVCSRFDVLNQEGCVCGRCTKVCPWTRPDSRPEDFADWDGSLDILHAGVNRQRALLAENNYVDPREATQKWWFELDETPEGDLVVPTGLNKHKICRNYPLAKEAAS